MRARTRRNLLTLAAVTVGAGWVPMPVQPTLAPESRLWIDGKSTVRSWSCKATALDATLTADGGASVTSVLEGKKAVATVDLTVPVAKLDCANDTMNGHMRKALNLPQHATIAFTLSSYELAAGATASATAGTLNGTLNGTLTINGVEKPVTLPVEFAAGASGTLKVAGSYALDMTEWGVKPPRLMLGTLKVNPIVTVSFDLLLR